MRMRMGVVRLFQFIDTDIDDRLVDAPGIVLVARNRPKIALLYTNYYQPWNYLRKTGISYMYNYLDRYIPRLGSRC